MAGNGPPASSARRRTNEPARGEWRSAPGIGWQHGDIPAPPPRLNAAAQEAWEVWFTAWYAANWAPEDLPFLRLIAQLYGKVFAGRATAAERSEFRQLADSMGITKKGQQDRRWTPPLGATAPQPGASEPVSPYAKLRAV